MNERLTTDRAKARYWHRLEAGLVLALAVVAGIGLWWSEVHNASRFIETRPR